MTDKATLSAQVRQAAVDLIPVLKERARRNHKRFC